MLLAETAIKRLVRPGELLEAGQDAVLAGLYRFRNMTALSGDDSLTISEVVQAAGLPAHHVRDGIQLALNRGLIEKIVTVQGESYRLRPEGVAFVERYRSQAFPLAG